MSPLSIFIECILSIETTAELLAVEWRVCLSSGTTPSVIGQYVLNRGQFHGCLQGRILCIANQPICFVFNTKAIA
jgi:hypothetical protein